MERRKDSKGRVLEKGESQRKDGTYVFQYSLNGSRKSVYAKTLNDLRKKEKQIKRDLEDGLKPEDITLNQMFDRYMAIKTGLKKSTILSYNTMYNKHIREGRLGKSKIANIKKSDLIAFCNNLVKEGYKKSSIAEIGGLINKALNLAYEDDLIRKNPYKGCLADFNNDSETRDALTLSQQEELLDFSKNSKIYCNYYPFFVLAIETAMRCGELTGLTWKDVDFESKTISVNHQIAYYSDNGKYSFRAETPKSASGIRIIPMSDTAYRILKEIKKSQLKTKGKCCICGYSDFIFASKSGKPILRQQINSTLNKLIKSHNKMSDKPKLPHISCHILRHTGCTRMAESGMDIKVLQYIMGHEDASTTMKIYNHISLERVKEAMVKKDNQSNDDLLQFLLQIQKRYEVV